MSISRPACGRAPRARATTFVLASSVALLAAACARAPVGASVAVRPVLPSADSQPCCGDSGRLDVPHLVAERYRVADLTTRRFSPATLWTALEPFSQLPVLRVTQIGRSVEGRPIRAFTYGSGPTTVLLWSQMHGDESTATMALADLMSWFADSTSADTTRTHDEVRARIASALTVVMVPMLNPDGALRAERENAVGVDINRDARRLSAPEARALRALRDSLRPAFGFNLHDQNPRVVTAPGNQQVAMALLAPSAGESRAFGETRAIARLVASEIATVLQRDLPGRVAMYDDTYNPSAFGELMQRGGTSTVLIETGALPDDPEKQRLRGLNVVAILTALDAIADGRFRNADPSVYESLPRNGRAAVDVLVRGGMLVTPGASPVRADIALEYDDAVAKRGPRVRASGNLPGIVALDTIDVTGLFLHPARAMLVQSGDRYQLRVGALATLAVRASRDRTSAEVRTIGDPPEQQAGKASRGVPSPRGGDGEGTPAPTSTPRQSRPAQKPAATTPAHTIPSGSPERRTR